MNASQKINKRRVAAVALATILTLTSTIAVLVSKTSKKESAVAATTRPIASNNIPDGQTGYIKLTKTATTTSIKDVWKIELGVSGKNPPPTYTEVMMVIDTSSSMNELGPGVQDYEQYHDNRSRIYGAKQAAAVLVDQFWSINPEFPHNPAMYRISTNTMGFDGILGSSPFSDAPTFDIMDSWTSVAPARSTPTSWTSSPTNIDTTMASIPNSNSIASATPASNNDLYTYKDKDAMLHNLKMLHAPAPFTSMGFAIHEALAKQYYDGTNYGTVPQAPPLAKQRKAIEDLKPAADRTDVIVKRVLVLVSDGAPTDGKYLDYITPGSWNESMLGGAPPSTLDQVDAVGLMDFSETSTAQKMFNGLTFRYGPAVQNLDVPSNSSIPSGNKLSNAIVDIGTLAPEAYNPIQLNSGIQSDASMSMNYATIKHFQAASTPTNPTSVYLVGLNLGTQESAFMNDIATLEPVLYSDAQYKNFTGAGAARAQALSDYFEKIVNDLKLPVMNAIVYDQLGEEFDLYHFEGNTADAEVEYSYWLGLGVPELVPQLTSNSLNAPGAKQTEKYFTYDSSAKLFEWRIDNFADYEDPDTMTYYVKLKPGMNIAGKTYATNNYAYIDYTNVNGVKAVKFFPNPFVSPDGIVETPNPKDEFPAGSEFDVAGYMPSVPSEGWKKKDGAKTTAPKAATVTKEEAAAKAAGKTLEEIAAEKKAAKKAADDKAKASTNGLTNEEIRAAEDQKVVDVAQKASDTAQANAKAAQDASDKAKSALAAAKSNKSTTPAQLSKLEAAAKSAAAKASTAKVAAEKAARTLEEKKAALANNSKNKKTGATVTPTPSPTPTPAE